MLILSSVKNLIKSELGLVFCISSYRHLTFWADVSLEWNLFFSIFILIGKAKKYNNKNRTKSNIKATKSLWTSLIAVLLRVLFNWVLWNQNQSNCNGQSEKGKYHMEPIRTQSKYMQMAWSAEKCEEQSYDWFWVCI